MNLPAKKVEIIALKERCEEILEEMQLGGMAEIISLRSEQEEDSDLQQKRSETELRLAEMRFARSFLSGFAEKEGFASNILNSFFTEKRKHTLDELKNLAESGRMKEVVDKCHQLEKGINQIESRKDFLKREIAELRKFSGIGISNKEDFKNFNLFIGSISQKKKEELINALKERSIFFYITWGGEEEASERGFYMIYPKQEVELVEIAKATGAREEEIFWNRPPEELLKEKRSELIELEKKKEERIKQAEEMSLEIPKLESLIDWYQWELDKFDTFTKGESTASYFYMKSWVLEGSIKELEDSLMQITPYVIVREIDPEEGEQPPVEMDNKDIMKSFEVVTGVYGSPKPDEPDPTPFLAPFFAVAFGLALSDAGYGILLMLLSFIMRKKMKGAESFFDLFIIAGGFTVIAGILTGTFFGTDLLARFRFVDAVADPIEVLYLVSVFGLIQIFVGILVGLFWSLKQGDRSTAFGEKGGFVVFFLGLGLFAITREINILLSAMILMMALNIAFCKGESLVKKLSAGFGSLYGLIGFFSDVLSYSRLLALGLATGIIAMTINMIAGIFMEMIPVTGLNVFVAGLVLVFGHVANLLINALSSFIHAARLQFVEFFSKFMEGGGRRFKPFSKQGRFVEIIK